MQTADAVQSKNATARSGAISIADQIDALLPQTQCTKCGYEGCRPYADAIARGDAEINQCPPGGAGGIEKLARLLERPPLPLNAVNGVERPLTVAVIDESRCIGCTLCLPACPVDAIVGAAKRMHTVIGTQCTGCDLCVAPCPVDCILMVPATPARQWTERDASAARRRYSIQRERRAASNEPRAASPGDQAQRKSTVVAAAIERAKQRRACAG